MFTKPKFNEETKETIYTKNDFLKQEIEQEIEQALTLLEDADDKLSQITNTTYNDREANNLSRKLFNIISIIKTEILDK